MNKQKEKNISGYIKTGLKWIIGCLCYATAVNGFALPNSIAQSGMTGAGVIFHKLFGFQIGVVSFLLNLPLLFLMWRYIGRKTFIRTIVVTAILSLALDGMAWMFANVLPVYTDDKIIASLVCGLLQGTGLGIIMTTGATSGGTDIIGRLVHKHWPHIPVGKVVLVADGLIVIANMLVFRSVSSGLYAIIVAYVSTTVIDALLYGMGNGKMLMIFTSKAQEVSHAMITSSRRGVTIIPAVGAYTGEDKNMLICVARKHEINALIKTVKSIDSETFIIVSEANEILGNGFTGSIDEKT